VRHGPDATPVSKHKGTTRPRSCSRRTCTCSRTICRSRLPRRASTTGNPERRPCACRTWFPAKPLTPFVLIVLHLAPLISFGPPRSNPRDLELRDQCARLACVLPFDVQGVDCLLEQLSHLGRIVPHLREPPLLVGVVHLQVHALKFDLVESPSDVDHVHAVQRRADRGRRFTRSWRCSRRCRR
jgi:hypothetical protein